MMGFNAVGNDVVDLSDADSDCNRLNRRFARRICSDVELDRLGNSAEPECLLWSLFAAKEAAYKVIAKMRPGTVFSPARFVIGDDARQISYLDTTLHLRIAKGRDFVHAVVSKDVAQPLSGIRRIPPEADPSSSARELLACSLAPRLGYTVEDLVVARDPDSDSWSGMGPPYVVVNGEPLGVDVSLSHHGLFVAFATSLPGSGP